MTSPSFATATTMVCISLMLLLWVASIASSSVGMVDSLAREIASSHPGGMSYADSTMGEMPNAEEGTDDDDDDDDDDDECDGGDSDAGSVDADDEVIHFGEEDGAC